MAQRIVDKYENAYLDFDDEAVFSLDQILDNISSSKNSLSPEITDEIPQEDFIQQKIETAINDVILLESNAVQVALADIDNLYKGTYIHDQAIRQQITEEEAREELRDNLTSQLKSWGMKCINKEHYPLPREIKHIIRMDFYGTVKEPAPEKLSLAFKERDMEDTIYNEPKDYNLTNSPTWNIFRQFRSFKLLERNLPQLLIDEGITPKRFRHLNSYDFSQVLYNYYIHKSKPKADEEKNANIFLGAKYRFVKTLIRNIEPELRYYMHITKVDYRYTNALVKNMKLYGITSNFDVINDVYTPEMLSLLKNRKLVSGETQVGSPILDEQANNIKKAGYINTIIARDENGNPVTGPSLTTHHNIAVQDCGRKINKKSGITQEDPSSINGLENIEDINFSEVNLFSKLVLMVELYHFIAHSLDKTVQVNNSEFYVSRLKIKPGVAFYGGFNKIFQIKHNFSIPHQQNHNYEALDNFRNEPSTYWQEFDKAPKKSRKQKKKQKNIQRIIKVIIPSQEDYPTILKEENNTRHKKEKRLNPNGSRTYRTREEISRQELKRNELLRQKRREYLSIRAAKKAALRSISESIPSPKIEHMIILNCPQKGEEKTIEQNQQSYKTIQEINRERINRKKELCRQRIEEQRQQQEQSQNPNILAEVGKTIIGNISQISSKTPKSIIDSLAPSSHLQDSAPEQKRLFSFNVTSVLKNNEDSSALKETHIVKHHRKRQQETKSQNTPQPQPQKVEKEATPVQDTTLVNTRKDKRKLLGDKKKRIDELKQKRAEELAIITAKKAERNNRWAPQTNRPQTTINATLLQQNIQNDARK